MTEKQHSLYQLVKQFVLLRNGQDRLYIPRVSAKDRAFVLQLARELDIHHGLDVPAESGDTKEKGQRLYLDWDSSDDETDEESDIARRRILHKYDKASIVSETMQAEERRAAEDRRVRVEFEDDKRDYYREKLHVDFDDKRDLQKLVYEYVEGLQWVLFYYYNGVKSWGWFYPHHYAPRITDLNDITDFKFNFDIGTPFHPFEQLMGVLPAGSRHMVPEAFRDLMMDSSSPILDFYPQEFELDMNGKKADWEAIVKIPFIDEKRLLSAMKNREKGLSADERFRNSFGPSWRFISSDTPQGTYPSPMPDVFPGLSIDVSG
jgi:5'-3' exoribonuclease 1